MPDEDGQRGFPECHPPPSLDNPLMHLSLQSSHRSLFQPTVIVPHAHWEAYGRGSPPLHYLVLDSANPHYVSDPLPQPLWGQWVITALDSTEP